MTLPRYAVGQRLTYTGCVGSLPAEFRGWHLGRLKGGDPLERFARVIIRPPNGPPFETSVLPRELKPVEGDEP